MRLRELRWLALLALVQGILPGCQRGDGAAKVPEPASILIVCEHGSVKSLMAASLFDRGAQERRLPFRAMARGVSPDASVPPRIAAALSREGFDVGRFVPRRFSRAEVEHAVRIVVIGVEPAVLDARTEVTVDGWSDVPAASQDYDAARASLARHVDALLNELEKHGTR